MTDIKRDWDSKMCVTLSAIEAAMHNNQTESALF